MDLEVRLAFDAGVNKSRLRREGLGTTDPATLEASLERTQGLARTERVDDVVRFTSTDELALDTYPLYRVTMSGDDWDQWFSQNKHRARVGGRMVDDTVANVYWAHGQWQATESDERGETVFDHPVARWVKENQDAVASGTAELTA